VFGRALRIALLLVISIAAVLAGVAASFLRMETIYPGVKVAGMDLGGLTKAEAENKLAAIAEEKAGQPLTMRCDDKTVAATLGRIGWRMSADACAEQAYGFGREGNLFERLRDVISVRRKGVELHVYVFSRRTATEFLRTAAKSINRPPTNARMTVDGGVISVIPEKPGLGLDIEKSLDRIVKAIDAGAREINLVAAASPPEITAADFKGIDGVVASYSTTYKPWERDRTHNLRIACSEITGTLVTPNEVFSYNKVVGPRLKEYGYRDAPIFVEGQVEPGTGGGVCQVSTTVYNAALLADMKILRRSHHSRPVVYAPVGRDATVAYPALDLRFRNTSDTPIYIMASVEKRTVDVTILGRKEDGKKVQLASAGHRVFGAPVTRKVQDSLPPGKPVIVRKGLAGHRVSTYRIVTLNGQVVKRELLSDDYYRPQPRIVAVPKPAPATEPQPAPPASP